MYEVSNDYMTAMHRKVQRHKIKGTIGSVAFTDANILAGSMTIVNQCSDNEKVGIGQVYIGELKATFLNVNISRGSWQGKDIAVTFSLLIDAENDTWEDVPVGVFTIAEANHGVAGIEVVAYDHMRKLDKSCSTVFSMASSWDMLDYTCQQCNVTLGNTQAQIEAMPNGTVIVNQYPDSDIETWRDMLSWITQLLCGYATAGRDGKIYVRGYGDTAVDTIDNYHRHRGAKFSDFTTRYTGVSVVNQATQITKYYGLSVDDGLTYNLGSNPFLQDGNVDYKATNILNALSVIDYVPFTASMIGNIAYDLGDVINFTDGIADDSMCCITKFVYTHHKGYSISGVGKNPLTATGKSKSDKNIAGLMNQVYSSEYSYNTFRNGKAIDVADGERKRIMRSSIICKENAQIKMDAEILIETEATEGNDYSVGTITYVLDNQELERHPVETWIDGDHILTLQYFMHLTEPGFHVFDIFLDMDDGNASIDQYGVMETFGGIGIAVTTTSAGHIFIDDTVQDPINIPETVFTENVEDVVAITTLIPTSITLTDSVGDISVPETIFDTSGLLEEVVFGDPISELTWGEAHDYTWAAAYARFHWGYIQE